MVRAKFGGILENSDNMGPLGFLPTSWFGDLKKGGTKGAQRICTYYAYFYVHNPVNGLEYVRWAYLNMSVGLRICPLGSFYAPFFFLGTLKKSSSFFITTLVLEELRVVMSMSI